MIEQDYHVDDTAGVYLPYDTEPVSKDYHRLLRCFWVFGAAVVVAGIVYVFLPDIKIAAGICGVVGVLLTLYHTPFGLFILFSLNALENAVVLSPYFTISKAMGIIVLVSFVLHMARAPVVVTKPLKWMIAFTIWATLTTIWSILPYYTLLVSLTFILNIGLAMIILSTVRDKKSLFLVVSGFTAGAIVASVMVAVGRVAYQEGQAAEVGRVTLSEETNTAVLALALGVGFLSAFYVFFQKGKYKKMLAVGSLALIFFAMVKTQSRMPTVAALSVPVIALVLGSHKSEHRMKYIVLGSLVAIAAFVAVKMVLASDLLSPAAKQRLQGEGFEESGRLLFWKWGFQAFVDRPFHGYGLNTFHLTPYNLRQSAAHNSVVAVAVDLGLIGLGLAIAIVLTLYKQVMRLSDVGLKWLGLAMLIYPLLTGVTVTNYIKKDFWYALAIVMAAIHIGTLNQQPGNSDEFPFSESEDIQ